MLGGFHRCRVKLLSPWIKAVQGKTARQKQSGRQWVFHHHSLLLLLISCWDFHVSTPLLFSLSTPRNFPCVIFFYKLMCVCVLLTSYINLFSMNGCCAASCQSASCENTKALCCPLLLIYGTAHNLFLFLLFVFQEGELSRPKLFSQLYHTDSIFLINL